MVSIVNDIHLISLCSFIVLVAEVTQPSLGVGYEIGRAFDFKLKVLCLFRPESGRSEKQQYNLLLYIIIAEILINDSFVTIHVIRSLTVRVGYRLYI